jgi:benzoyl-CoA reductase/2-hydroxyglutaryl-CoA dehydratase subunit BcrC/BadD/HgdB
MLRKAAMTSPAYFPDIMSSSRWPHKAVDYSIDFFTEELQDMIATIGESFREKIEESDLRKSIRLYNTGRKHPKKSR